MKARFVISAAALVLLASLAGFAIEDLRAAVEFSLELWSSTQ